MPSVERNDCYNSRVSTDDEAESAAVRRRRVQGSGLELAVAEYGDTSAPTVILVHGFPNTSAIWAPVAQNLARDFHVATYDVRGAGASDVPRTRMGYALSILVEDMAAVIDHVSPDAPVHLVAHDWGSIQGWEAVTTPLLTERIASYTSISGPPIAHAATVGAAALDPASGRPPTLAGTGPALVVHRPLSPPVPAATGDTRCGSATPVT